MRKVKIIKTTYKNGKKLLVREAFFLKVCVYSIKEGKFANIILAIILPPLYLKVNKSEKFYNC